MQVNHGVVQLGGVVANIGSVLQLHPSLEGAEIIAEMRHAGWLDAGEDDGSARLRRFWQRL